MNESITAAICQDAYSDALTLGPEPGIMDGCDITIEAADVLMSFNIGPNGENYWDSTEYRMRPGTRHVDNVCGVRFRNYVAGGQAQVTAALTGPAKPRLGPIMPLAGEGVGDPLVALMALEVDAGEQDFGPFDVGDWRALLIFLRQTAAGGARVQATYILEGTDVVIPALEVPPGVNESAVLVCENVAQEVKVKVFGAAVGTIVDVLVAPCGLDGQQIGAGGGTSVLRHDAAHAINAGQTLNLNMRPFLGKANTVFRGLTGGPYNVQLQILDYTGAVVGILVDQEATQGFALEHPIVPSGMSWAVTNTAGAAGTFNLDTVIEEPA